MIISAKVSISAFLVPVVPFIMQTSKKKNERAFRFFDEVTVGCLCQWHTWEDSLGYGDSLDSKVQGCSVLTVGVET